MTDTRPAPRDSAANPDVEFFLILNPNSGPVRDVQDPSLYCVPTLRARVPRSTLIGYVRTGYGSRPAGQVDADVATYASWADLRVDVQGAGAPKLDGIFFDEVPDGTTRKLKDLYAGYAETARGAFPNGTVSRLAGRGAQERPAQLLKRSNSPTRRSS